MPHDLATIDGRPAMAYAGPTPWHGLGTPLAEPATASQAIAAAGLDFAVDLCEVRTTDGLPVASRRAVVRQDTQQVLGVVGRNYRPVQNRAAFDFLDELVGEGRLRYHTAGALGSGERVWLLAQLPDDLRVDGTDDVVEKYLLLSNSHDGGSSLRIHFTPIRVVCSNTLLLAERRGRGQGVAIAHRGDIRRQLDRAREVLGLADLRFDRFGGEMNRLARRYLSVSDLDEYLRSLYPDRPDAERSRARAVRNRITHLFEHGRGQDLPGIRHTAWAAVNAVVEHVDYERTTRGQDERTRADRRLASAWFGGGAKLKQRAWEAALTLAN